MTIQRLRNLPDVEKGKIFAARHALQSVESGMNIGLGTGSTAAWFVRLLAGEQKRGLKFHACATSRATSHLARSFGIKIKSLSKLERLDLAIDGTDEFDRDHNLIKGGGGALLREKIVESAAERFVVITDSSKSVRTLGKFPLPVEVDRFEWRSLRNRILWILSRKVKRGYIGAAAITQRMNGNGALMTDGGNYILDLHLKSIARPNFLHRDLRKIPGVVETGLFLDMADTVVMADGSGSVKSRDTGGKWDKYDYELEEVADRLKGFAF